MRKTVNVKPGSSKGDSVIEQEDGSLIVYLKARAVDGKANKSLIEVLAEHYSVKKADITIKAGKASRKKIVDIDV